MTKCPDPIRKRGLLEVTGILHGLSPLAVGHLWIEATRIVAFQLVVHGTGDISRYRAEIYNVELQLIWERLPEETQKHIAGHWTLFEQSP